MERVKKRDKSEERREQLKNFVCVKIAVDNGGEMERVDESEERREQGDMERVERMEYLLCKEKPTAMVIQNFGRPRSHLNIERDNLSFQKQLYFVIIDIYIYREREREKRGGLNKFFG